jgi:voltage-gated potassium channel
MHRRPPEAAGPRRSRGGRPNDDLEELLERADPVMAWLGVLFALLVLYELAVPLGPTTSLVLEVAGWLIWAVFAAELGAHLWLAEEPARYLRRHWLQVLALLVPTLRMLRFLRLVRLGRGLPAARLLSSGYRAAGSSRRLLASRLEYLAATSAVVVVLVAELAYLFEREVEPDTFPTFPDAVLWSAAVVLAMQGDPTPVDRWARLAMTGGFVWGLVVIGTVAGSVGSYLVESRRDAAS